MSGTAQIKITLPQHILDVLDALADPIGASRSVIISGLIYERAQRDGLAGQRKAMTQKPKPATKKPSNWDRMTYDAQLAWIKANHPDAKIEYANIDPSETIIDQEWVANLPAHPDSEVSSMPDRTVVYKQTRSEVRAMARDWGLGDDVSEWPSNWLDVYNNADPDGA